MPYAKEIIKNLSEDNLVEAKQLIHRSLLEKLGTVLEEKIEQVAPSMVSEKKLDPVGKEDKDVDNNNKVDDSDSYLLKRRKAISIAKKKKIDEDIDTVEEEPEINQEFEDFVDQIQEIVQEIEEETGEELSEEEIISIGKEYLEILKEEQN